MTAKCRSFVLLSSLAGLIAASALVSGQTGAANGEWPHPPPGRPAPCGFAVVLGCAPARCRTGAARARAFARGWLWAAEVGSSA